MPSFSDLAQMMQQNSIVWVLSVFVLILLWTYWPSRKARIEAHGRIPLDEEA
jgi:cbb3-type cytochrome oxidase subunit 3